jgi:hypothetical protein
MTEFDNAPVLVWVTWFGTTGKLNAEHESASAALAATRENWRLYCCQMPTGLYAPGQTITDDDQRRWCF